MNHRLAGASPAGAGVRADASLREWTPELLLPSEADALARAAALFTPAGHFVGTPGKDTLVGTAGDDTIEAGAGADSLKGDIGDDLLDGGAGSDTMGGDGGDDTYVVENIGDTISELLDKGSDTVQSNLDYTLGANLEHLRLGGSVGLKGTGNAAANKIDGNKGGNLLAGLAGDDSIHGADGSDTINGGTGLDTLWGGDGEDILNGGTDTVYDELHGGKGEDSLIGGGGGGKLYGDEGADTLVGGTGFGDFLYGGSGDDSLVSGSTGDQLNGEDGNDALLGSASDDGRLSGGRGDDSIDGGAGNDLVSGDEGSDTVLGGDGNDYLSDDASNIADTLSGGAGLDILNADWSGTTLAIVWDNDPAVSKVVNGNTVSGIERLYLMTGSGSDVISNLTASGDDHFIAGAGNDSVSAGAGSDGLEGGSGNDTLTGGVGDDYLTGGSQVDTFSFDSLTGFDRVSDFMKATDKLRIVQSKLSIGDGDTVIEGAKTISSPGGFTAAAELVIATQDVAGVFTTAKASAVIGGSSTAYAINQTALFVVDNGVDTAIYRFKAFDVNGAVSAGELTLLATLAGANSTAATDFVFST